MLKVFSILVTRIGLGLSVVALCACGLKGPLRLPSDEASKGRATLLESLTPDALRERRGPTSAPTPTPQAPAPESNSTQPVTR